MTKKALLVNNRISQRQFFRGFNDDGPAVNEEPLLPILPQGKKQGKPKQKTNKLDRMVRPCGKEVLPYTTATYDPEGGQR